MAANNQQLATQIATLRLEIAALKAEVEKLKASKTEVHNHYHYSYPAYRYWYEQPQPYITYTSGTLNQSASSGLLTTSGYSQAQDFIPVERYTPATN